MLIIRSRGTAQEVRRLASDLQRVIGWSNSGVTGKNTCGLPVGAVHPNRPCECDHVMKQAIEVNRPYLRDQKFATARARASGRRGDRSPETRPIRRCSRST
jgi:ribosomal protein L34E